MPQAATCASAIDEVACGASAMRLIASSDPACWLVGDGRTARGERRAVADSDLDGRAAKVDSEKVQCRRPGSGGRETVRRNIDRRGDATQASGGRP